MFPKATPETIQAAEQQLGFPLPGLLREPYLNVGNGGFGPGYGLFGVADGAPAITSDSTHHDLVSFYRLYRGEIAFPRPPQAFLKQGRLFLETFEAWYDHLVQIPLMRLPPADSSQGLSSVC